MAERRIVRVLALVSLVGLLVAGCATIPSQTMPQPLDFGSTQDTGVSVPQPPKDATPLDIVRGFVENGADPADNHAAARAYLADSAKQSWNDSGTITIIDDTFSTIKSPSETPDANTQTVILRGETLGQLGADDAFAPAASPYEMSVQVARQSDGNWRIVHPSDGVVMTQTSFNRYYRGVSVYFFDPYFGSLVPDLRYVAANPLSGLAARIIDVLLSGPSNALADAVKSAIPPDTQTKSTPAESADGSIVVNLDKLSDQSDHTKQLIIAQIVKTLQGVASNPVRVDLEGVPLEPDHPVWRASDLPAYNASTTPNGSDPGLVVAHGRVMSLKDGSPVPGDAGNGAYQVLSAAQSIDGSELAMVCQSANGPELRVGRYGTSDGIVQLSQPIQSITRPTWAPGGASGEPSGELWTVLDGSQGVRVVQTQQGTWVAQPIDVSPLVNAGGPITDLRLSRDGTRVAAIAGGHLVVGAVVSNQNSVTIKQVAVLQADSISNAVSVDWDDQATLVVATTQPAMPVASVSVDGLTLGKYNTSNLTGSMTAITAEQNRPVIIVDSAGMWMSSDSAEVWAQAPHDQGAGAIPFYPG